MGKVRDERGRHGERTEISPASMENGVPLISPT